MAFKTYFVTAAGGNRWDSVLLLRKAYYLRRCVFMQCHSISRGSSSRK